MSIEEGVDEELRAALTVTPLIHLVPKQGLAPLVSPLVLAEPVSLPSSLPAKQIDIHDSELLDLLGADLMNYDDDSELIQFKRFPSTQKVASEVPLSSVEKRLLDRQQDNQYTTSEQKTIQGPRLSIRKKYDMDDITTHNQTYERKFSREISKEVSPSTKRSADEVPDSGRKIVKFSDSDLRKAAAEKVEHLIKDVDFDGPKLDGILEAIKLLHKDLDMDGCVKIQKLCHGYLVDMMGELAKRDLADLPSVNTNLQSVQSCVVASSCILWIMNDNVGSKTLLVGEYVIEIANLVYLIVSSLLVAISEGPPGDDSNRAWVVRIVSELASLLRLLGKLNSNLSLEEEALTKLELASVQLVFEELFNRGKSMSLPIESLRSSAALFITDIHKHSVSQRPFLLNELIMNFLRLPTKKLEARNYQTERGVKVQLFSMIAVRISHEHDDAGKLALGIVQRVIEKFDAASKALFEFFMEDLNLMLSFPEWAAGAVLLKALVEQVLSTLMHKENPPPVEVYFLEVLANTCKNVLVLKNVAVMADKEEILAQCSKYGSPDATAYMERLLEDQPDDKFSYVQYLLRGLDGFTSVFLSSLGHLLESPKTKIKTKTVKILAMLSEYHPNLLASAALQQSLSARLCDEATLVRDAAYEFLGKYIRAHPNDADKFCNQLCNALSDEGISVRKKAIRLTKDIYSMFGADAKVSVGTRLLKRLNDEEDNIKSEAVTMMMECWIVPLGDHSRCKTATTEIINLARSHHKTLENLELFLESYVFKKPNVLNLVSCLIESLLDFVSDDSETKEGALLLLSICSKCKPDLMGQNQLIALQPFLTDESNCSTKSYRFALRVLKNILPTVTSLRPDFIDPVQGFLLKKLTKFSHTELHEAIPSLWQFCKIKKDFLKMVNAAVSTMKMMRKYIDHSHRDNRLAKLIQLLSCLVKHCQLENHRETFINAGVGLKHNEPVVSLAVKYVTSFCQTTTPLSVEVIAVSSLLVTCSNYPRILMSAPVLAVFDGALESTPEMIKAVIQSMIRFLREKESASTSTKSNLEDIVDDACPGIVQRYISRMLSLSLSDKGEYAYLPFQFVQVALELGFANPKICIPTIIALEASPVAIIQSSATNMHRELFGKHESLVDSSYQEGIRLAFENKLLSTQFFCVVHSILHASKMARNKFIHAICRSMTLDKVEFLLFCIERIPLVGFRSMEEIFIILLELQDKIHSADAGTVDHAAALSVYAMIELYRHLTAVYRITDEQVESFGAGSLEIDQRHTPKESKNATLSLEWFHENINNADCLEECIKYIKEFV
ncbi:Sister chromatid cohesion protein 2 [Candida viswanathii]|uniref:Sister chromatid cohesion protein n=1 Tax=Candida viswanathii TaxID=5486 RepID=A0A367XQN7_9ASCO|nr:Sister chromatid cohesion protein 2 [Candida viswanathii]